MARRRFVLLFAVLIGACGVILWRHQGTKGVANLSRGDDTLQKETLHTGLSEVGLDQTNEEETGWSLSTMHLKLTKASDLDLDKEIEKDLNICNDMYMDDNVSSQYHQTLKRRLDILQEYIPEKYSTEFKNPCWYDFHQIPPNFLNQKQECIFPVSIDPALGNHTLEQMKSSSRKHLHCLPAFFLSGFPKCATSSLNRMILQHPQIAKSKCKESGFWSRFVSEPSTDLHKRMHILWYLNHFFQSVKAFESNQLSITLDATVAYSQYLSNDYCVLPVLLKRVLPEVKFVLIMRNPSERYFSHYWLITAGQKVKNYTEFVQYVHTKKALEVFKNDTVSAIAQFQSCVDREKSIPYCVINEKVSIRAGLQQGLYYYHIVPWLKIISRERFLFLRTEDLARDASQTMSKVWQFLDLNSFPEAKSVFINRGPAKNHLTFTPQARKLLNAFYQPYNQLLAHLLSDKRFLWDN